MHVIFGFFVAIILQKGIYGIECPSRSNEWPFHLETFAKTLIPDLGNNDLYKQGPKLLPIERYQNVLNFWNNCKGKAGQSIQKKFSNILKHSRFMLKAQAKGHSGFKVSDEEYLLRSLNENMNFAEIPKVFFKDNYLPDGWKKIIEKCDKTPVDDHCHEIRHWKIIEFHSTLEDGQGNHRRVVVQIPRKNFQQYLLFFPDHTEHKKTNLVNIIAIQTHDLKTNRPLQKVIPYFFERHNGGFARDGGRCISCHPNGLREIVPIQGSLTNLAQRQVIHEFNAEVKKFGRPSWKGLVDYSALGPAMGKSCVECHNMKKGRTPLTIFTSPSLIRSKVQEHEMPRPEFFKEYLSEIYAIPSSLGRKTKLKIKNLSLTYKARPGRDYRTREEIMEVRRSIQKELLKQGRIGYWKYLFIRGEDYFGSLYSGYKLRGFFDRYKHDLFLWLKGSYLE